MATDPASSPHAAIATRLTRQLVGIGLVGVVLNGITVSFTSTLGPLSPVGVFGVLFAIVLVNVPVLWATICAVFGALGDVVEATLDRTYTPETSD